MIGFQTLAEKDMERGKGGKGRKMRVGKARQRERKVFLN